MKHAFLAAALTATVALASFSAIAADQKAEAKTEKSQMQPRIPYPDLSKKPESVQKMVARTPINVTKMMAHASPGVTEGFGKFGAALYLTSPLPANLREIGILRAGYIAKSRYETFQHESVAKSIGFSDEKLAAVKKGGKHPGVLSPVEQAVMDFADDFIVNVRVSDANLNEVRKHLTDEQLFDLMMVTGTYMTISRILETTGVPLDEKPVDRSDLDRMAKDQ